MSGLTGGNKESQNLCELFLSKTQCALKIFTQNWGDILASYNTSCVNNGSMLKNEGLMSPLMFVMKL